MLKFESGFKENQELNPKLWEGEVLRPEVRRALLKIASNFKKYIDIEFSLVDIVVTGSQTGYYYTKYSDLDLHLIVNYREVECDRELDELFDTKRHLYNRDHNITIYGIPVEVYVEDAADPGAGPAWSLGLNRWLRPPQSHGPKRIDLEKIQKETRMWVKIIDRAIESKDVKILEKTQKLLKKYRVLGLKKTGEFGVANLVYKTLRNSKILEKLSDQIERAQDHALSLR